MVNNRFERSTGAIAVLGSVLVFVAWVPRAVGQASISVTNSGFESAQLGGQTTYTKTFGTLDPLTGIPGWTFGTSSGGSYDGIVRSGGLGATAPPEGSQAAFLQGTGSFYHALNGFVAGTEQVTFYAEGRPGGFGPQPIEVLLDGTPLTFGGLQTVSPASGSWISFTSDLAAVTVGSHTLTFSGTVPYGTQDFTTFLDKISVVNNVAPAIWSGGGSPAFTWSNTGNWSAGAVPASGQSLTFGGSLGTSNTNDLPPGSNVGGITFASTAAAFTLSGNSLQLGGNIFNSSTATQTIALNLGLTGGDRSITANSGSIVISSAIRDGEASHGIVVGGSNSVTLTASNTYTGGTTINAGTLNVTSGGVLNGTTSVITQSGGALNLSKGTVTMGPSASGVFGVGYGVAGTSTVTVGSGSVLNVGNGGGRTFIGGGPSGGPYGAGLLNINAGGLLSVAPPGLFPNERFYLGGFGGSGTVSLAGGTLSLARDVWAGGASSVINLNGGVLQAAAGYVSENNDNTSPSPGFISGGPAVNIQGGGVTIDSNGNNLVLPAPLLDGGGGGGLIKAGGGMLTLTTASNYTGRTTVTGGTLRLGDGVSANGTLIGPVTNNAAFVIANPNPQIYSGGITGSGGLVKTGNGVLVLGGTNTYQGSTIITAGTIQLAVASRVPSGTKIMPVGDSITYGVGGTNAGYRGYLYSSLTAAGNSSNFQFVGTTNGNPGSLPTSPVDQTAHDGWSGWTTAQIESNIGAWLTQLTGSGQTPTVITMMIGTNDYPVSGYSVSQGTTNLAAIINTIFAQDPTGRLLLAKLTPRYDNSTYTNWVNSYNALLPSLVAQKQAAGDNITLVDMNTNFPSDGLTSDNLHPNDDGYAWMANQWLGAILPTTTSGTSTAIPSTSPTTVASGAAFVLAGNTATIGPLDGAGSIMLGTSGQLTVNSTAGNDSTFSGAISGAGRLVKTGPAMLTLSGSNSYLDGTTVSDGKLIVDNSEAIADGTSLAVGDPTMFPAAVVPPGVETHGMAPVPEPGTLGLFIAAICGAAGYRRLSSRRKMQ